MPNKYELRSAKAAASSDSKPVVTHSPRAVASGSGGQQFARADGSQRPMVVQPNKTRHSQPRSRANQSSKPKQSQTVLHQVREGPKFKSKTSRAGRGSAHTAKAATDNAKRAQPTSSIAARSPSLASISPAPSSASGKFASGENSGKGKANTEHDEQCR